MHPTKQIDFQNNCKDRALRRIVSILVWSAISAAFIGPGTVTTTAASGARFGYSLLWALVFSTAACLALQEASARLTIVTGKPLARALGGQFGAGKAGRLVPFFVVGAVVLGCAAYQAGNIMGAVAGASLGIDMDPRWITLAIGATAAVILFAGSARAVARILGLVVAVMGVAFLACAVDLGPELGPLLKGFVTPTIPAGAGLLALGLVGTTVVPYNLFLGSGLAKGQGLGEARFGLAVAIPLGGLISMGILVTGTAVVGDFSFPALSEALEARLGSWAGTLFAIGLFAAGLSSAITAPLAAALSVKGVAERDGDPSVRGATAQDGDPSVRSATALAGDPRWCDSAWRYRAVWAGVLVFGLAFGLFGRKPIPVILLAQALNGVLLPFVALFLWIAVNDGGRMGRNHLPGIAANLVLGLSVLVAILMGASGVLRAGFSVAGAPTPSEKLLLIAGTVLAALLAVPVLKKIQRRRSP